MRNEEGLAFWSSTKTIPETEVCATCHQPADKVHHTLRLPKQRNIKAWDLLYEIMHADFSQCHRNSLGYFWHKNQKIGCTLHLRDEDRAHFWIPKHQRELPEWKQYMATARPKLKTTKFPSQ